MKRATFRWLAALAFLPLAALPGAAAQQGSAGEEACNKSPNFRGTVQDGIYYSPDKSFHVRIPRLSQPGAACSELTRPDLTLINFSDDFCRQFQIVTIKGALRSRNLETWLDDVLLKDMRAQAKIKVTERQAAGSRLGKLVFMKLEATGRSPCLARTTSPDGKVKRWRPNSLEYNYFFAVVDRVFQITYWTSAKPLLSLQAVEDRKNIRRHLDDFLSGFDAGTGPALAIDKRKQPARKSPRKQAARNPAAKPSPFSTFAAPAAFAAAVTSGDTLNIGTMIAGGNDPNAPFPFRHPKFAGGEEQKGTPLLVAAIFGHTNMVKALLDHGASLAIPGNAFAICPAIGFGHAEIVRVLIAKGANVNPDFGCGKGGRFSPLQFAKFFGHQEIEKMVGAAGGKP